MNAFSTTLTVLAILACLATQAQTNTGKITGQVSDGHQSIHGATISLLKAKDSALVKIALSDKAGRFELEKLPEGQYLLLYTAIGHAKVYSVPVTVAPAAALVELQPVVLTAASRDMKEVTIVARKPMVEQKMDRTVVNVDAFVSNAGANALEALEKAPGVQVDKDGNISLKGKQGVTILIDGRPAYLNGAELANMLRGLQASQLETIEVMTNPPAKYDASGNSGIINIKTKKSKVKGFNGNINVGYSQGVYAKTNESISLNYRNGKVNLFSNYSFNLNDNFQQLDIFRRYKNDDGSTNAIFQQVSYTKRHRLNNNMKLGMDYFLSKKTTIGLVVSGYYNPQTSNGINTSYLQNPGYQTDSIVTANSDSKERWKNISANLNLRHQFDTTGRELTADLDVIAYGSSNNQYFTNTTLTPQWAKKYDELLQGNLPVNIKIYSGKVDYSHPFSKTTRLEMGAKSSYVTTNNKANYYKFENNEWQVDWDKTNLFDYKENINAAYVSLNKQLTKKLGMQAGLRFENTHYEGHQYGNLYKTDSSFSRTYNNLFPTVYFSYAADKRNQFGLSFGRRIDRPSYENLNPFMFFIDKYTYNSGNPFLRPQYSNNIEATHIYKGFLTTTINYSNTKDLFNETFDQSGYATVVRNGNIGRRQNAGVSVSAQVPVNKWLTTVLYTNYNYTKYSGRLYGSDINIGAGNLLVNMNSQLRFKKGWSGELSGWYRTKGVEGQILLKAMGQLSAGVAKQVLQGKGTLKLGVRDLFYTQTPQGTINFKSTEASFRNTRDSRVVNLTFTYRFGKQFKVEGQRQKGGASDEQNRIKGGS